MHHPRFTCAQSWELVEVAIEDIRFSFESLGKPDKIHKASERRCKRFHTTHLYFSKEKVSSQEILQEVVLPPPLSSCSVCECKGTSILSFPFTLLTSQNQRFSIFLHFAFEEMCSFRYPNSLYFAYFLLPLIIPNTKLCFPISYSLWLLFLQVPSRNSSNLMTSCSILSASFMPSLTAVPALCPHNHLNPMTQLRYIVLRPFPLSSEICP